MGELHEIKAIFKFYRGNVKIKLCILGEIFIFLEIWASIKVWNILSRALTAAAEFQLSKTCLCHNS